MSKKTKFLMLNILILNSLVIISSVFSAGQKNIDREGTKKLIINSNQSDPGPKAALAKTVSRFQSEYPDIEVQLNTFDYEAYKTSITSFLENEAPDICFWNAGNRMKRFVQLGLFLDVSDLWKEEGLYDSMSSSVKSMTIDNKQYGLPWSYYHWGIFYRRDIFEQYGLTAPVSWEEFIKVSDSLIANGITPISIGTKYPWTAAAWFDYINLRVNGYDFHSKLMEGRVLYTDNKLDKVFDLWGSMIKKGYFLINHESYSWHEALNSLIKGDTAMSLSADFLLASINNEAVLHSLAFFPFPTIDPAMAPCEVAPIATIHIPAQSRNVEAAKLFMKFMARPDIQNAMTAGSGTLAVHKTALLPEDPFKKAGSLMLRSAAALVQPFDKSTSPEMAVSGQAGFQEFMLYPDNEDIIRVKLDKEITNLIE